MGQDLKLLLYINPPAESKSDLPHNDQLTSLMDLALQDALPGAIAGNGFDPDSRYRGVHTTECGMTSSNCDYLLRDGIITNSLASYYLRWYRDFIDPDELLKVQGLQTLYEKPNENSYWKKEDLVLYILKTFPYYFFPKAQVSLHRGSSKERISETIDFFISEKRRQNKFFASSDPSNWAIMMDKGPKEFQHLAMLAHFGHKGWRISTEQIQELQNRFASLN